MQIIRNEPYWMPALSNTLGALGNAASNIGVGAYEAKTRREMLKQEKQQQVADRVRQGQAYSALLGVSPDQGNALANAPIDIQKAMVQQIIERGGIRQGGQQQMGMGGMQMQQSPMDALQQLGSSQSQQIPMGGLTMSNIAQSLQPQDPGSFLTQRVLGSAAAGIQPSLESRQQKQVSPENQLEKDIDTAVRNYDINQGIDMQPTNISGLLSSGMSKEEAKRAMNDAADYNKTLNHEVKGGKDIQRITNKMVDIVERDIESGGKLLRGPAMQTLFDSAEGLHGKGGLGGLGGAIGGILGSIISPGAGTYIGGALGAGLGGLGATAIEALGKSTATKETQEFQKLSAEFIKGAKGIFGSRITDADLNMFMKMVPTLSNTNEGKLAVLRNIQLVNDATLVKGKVRDRIIKSNGGRMPYNLEQMVEDIADPIIDQMADKFKQRTESMEGNATKRSNPKEFSAQEY